MWSRILVILKVFRFFWEHYTSFVIKCFNKVVHVLWLAIVPHAQRTFVIAITIDHYNSEGMEGMSFLSFSH